MIKSSSRISVKSLLLVTVPLFLLALFVSTEKIGFLKKVKTCEQMVDEFVKVDHRDIKTERANHVKDACYDIVLKTGNPKELYAYYRFYKHADDINAKYNQKNNKDKDLAPNDVYHWMLFYANQNSRIFNDKTGNFENEYGLYEQELKDFEEAMSQEERIKSFSYIADNIATGEEGWVKTHDYNKSFEYLKKAAEAGDYSSQNALGIRLFIGSDRYNQFPIEKDYVQGYKWIYLSTLHSRQDSYYRDLSLKSFDILKKQVTQKQINQAKDLAGIWLRQNSAFLENHPLQIIPISEEEIRVEKEKTEKFIKERGLDIQLSRGQ
jgi:hypothetical protein